LSVTIFIFLYRNKAKFVLICIQQLCIVTVLFIHTVLVGDNMMR